VEQRAAILANGRRIWLVRAAVLIEPGKVELRDVPRPECGPNDVVVAPRAVGICGSDMHLYRHGRIGTSVVERPLVLGHEPAGEVVEVGAEVEGLRVGDRVIVEPGISCGTCYWCHHGDYNLCPHVRFLGIPPSDGAMSELVGVPARYAHKMPESMSWADGAMIEPFAVGLEAVKRAGVRTGDSVVVLGAGPIGLMILQAARIAGATTLISVDVAERPLAMASQLGATAVLDGRTGELAERVRELTGGRGADHAIEAVGAPATVQSALDVVRRGGTVTLVGIAAAPGIPLDTIKIVRTGLTVRSSFRYAHVHPGAISLAAEGRVDLKTLVTKSYAFADVGEAFREVDARKSEIVKGVVEL
jgi:L-iditol 2-dehydrogenase